MNNRLSRARSFRRVDDYEAVKELAIRAGLDVVDKSVEDIVAAFGYYIGESLMATAALEREDGQLFLEWVAVDSSIRMRGVGASLVAMVEDEARTHGMKELWAKARIPEFYRRIGFRILEKDEIGPKTLEGCVDCPEFGTSCNPAIVVRDLGDDIPVPSAYSSAPRIIQVEKSGAKSGPNRI
ncbi:MAG TPA: GNAT family N-acetyltransferase [Thermoplasmata archaeon]|nr:GNAT family N-acetyltransferase [Thermoplasmata archaeon]